MSSVVPHHPDSFDGWIFHWIHRGGCPALFGVLLLCGVGLPLPEDIPLIAAGFFIQRGEMNLALAAICAWCGIIGGDCILYMLGRSFGAEVSKIPFIGRHVDVKRMARVETWFARYGVWVVMVGRLFAGIRGAMVVVAGATKFNFVKFIVADSLAAVVSGGLFMFLGYKFAKHLRAFMHDTLPYIKHWMMLGLVVLLLGLLVYVLWRRRQRRIAGLPGFPVEPMPAEATPTK
ncbi:MAG TPA: DedA family protein [Tepidisphaeraceae bacterium]|jgi:membrane protein DedA with SNARE-associated domain|nr:DedA family protein [Tepidisphaeraceae bacterium]